MNAQILDVIQGPGSKGNDKFSFKINEDYDELHWSISMLLDRHNQVIHEFSGVFDCEEGKHYVLLFVEQNFYFVEVDPADDSWRKKIKLYIDRWEERIEADK